MFKGYIIRTVGINEVSDVIKGISNKNHNEVGMIEISVIPDTNFYEY